MKIHYTKTKFIEQSPCWEADICSASHGNFHSSFIEPKDWFSSEKPSLNMYWTWFNQYTFWHLLWLRLSLSLPWVYTYFPELVL